MAIANTKTMRRSPRRVTWPITSSDLANRLSPIPESPPTLAARTFDSSPPRRMFGEIRREDILEPPLTATTQAFSPTIDLGTGFDEGDIVCGQAVQISLIKPPLTPPRSRHGSEDSPAVELVSLRNQVAMYSKHVASSYDDRERLCSKIEELQSIVKKSSSLSVRLADELRLWQDNYRDLEVEITELAKELDRTKRINRVVETERANLRSAIDEMQQIQYYSFRQRTRRGCKRCWSRCRELPCTLADALRKPINVVRRRLGYVACLPNTRSPGMGSMDFDRAEKLETTPSRVRLVRSGTASRLSGRLDGVLDDSPGDRQSILSSR